MFLPPWTHPTASIRRPPRAHLPSRPARFQRALIVVRDPGQSSPSSADAGAGVLSSSWSFPGLQATSYVSGPGAGASVRGTRGDKGRLDTVGVSFAAHGPGPLIAGSPPLQSPTFSPTADGNVRLPFHQRRTRASGRAIPAGAEAVEPRPKRLRAGRQWSRTPFLPHVDHRIGLAGGMSNRAEVEMCSCSSVRVTSASAAVLQRLPISRFG